MNHLPKIPLDSASDLQFIQGELHSALLTRLQIHLPDASREDTLHQAIEAHISSFLETTMTDASRNVLINGMEPVPADLVSGQKATEEYEPLDAALHAKVLNLHQQLEDQISRITNMRRKIPIKIRDFEELHAKPIPQPKLEFEDELPPEHEFVIPEIPRMDSILKNYDHAMRLMSDLKATVPSTMGKVQRSKEVMDYLESQR